MGNYIPNGFSQVSLLWQLGGDPETVVCTFGMTGDMTQPKLVEICDHFQAAWQPADLSNKWTFNGARSTTGPSGEGEMYEEPRTVPGTMVTAILPSNCAIGIRKSTAVGGRVGKGRWYWPAGYLPEGNVDELGIISTTARGILQGKASAFVTNMKQDGPIVLLHSDPARAPTPVNSVTIVPKIFSTPHRMGR
jgi:hypothetical protein